MTTMPRSWSIIWTIILLCAVSSARGEVVVCAQSAGVQLNDTFVIQVEITGRVIGPLQVGESDGLRINPNPVEHRDEMQVAGGMVSSRRIQAYQAQATRLGTVEVPVFSALVDGQRQQSVSFTITVVPGRPADAIRNRIKCSTGEEQGTDNRELRVEDIAKVKAEVSKEEVYSGEAVVLLLSLYEINHRSVELGRARGNEQPSTEGFYAIPQNPEQLTSNYLETKRDGKWDYHVTQWRQVLYPTQPGQATIGPWRYEALAHVYTEGRRWQQQNVVIASEPITVKVYKLPPAPDGFSGAVGQFRISGKLESPVLQQGVPGKLNVVITGTGNPNGIGEPALPAVNETRIVLSDTQIEPQPTPVMEAPEFKKLLVYSVTPSVAGKIVIPAFPFVYFDPIAEKYISEMIGPFTINVPQSDETDAGGMVDLTGASPATAATLDLALQPIITTPGELTRSPRAGLATTAAFTLPPVIFAAFAVYTQRQRRLLANPALAIANAARQRLDLSVSEAGQSPEPASALFQAVLGFIRDKMSIQTSGMTSIDTGKTLTSHNISPETVKLFSRILQACERASYSGAELTSQEFDALAAGVEEAADSLESEVGRGKRQA